MGLVHIADNEKLLVVLDELRDVFAEEGERRIGDDDIGFLEEFDAFGRAEVAVALEACEDVLAVLDEVFDVGDVNRAVAVLVTNFGDNDLVGASFVAGAIR